MAVAAEVVCRGMGAWVRGSVGAWVEWCVDWAGRLAGRSVVSARE